MTLKSSFLSEEPERRISSGYCRVDRPSSVYWTGGPVRGRLVVRGQVSIIIEVGVHK